MANTHPLSGARLQQPDPAPLRTRAMFDPDEPCTEHSTHYTGRIPCTGDLACRLCGTRWDDAGNVLSARTVPLA